MAFVSRSIVGKELINGGDELGDWKSRVQAVWSAARHEFEKPDTGSASTRFGLAIATTGYASSEHHIRPILPVFI